MVDRPVLEQHQFVPSLGKPRNIISRKVQMMSHGDTGTSITTPPAAARITNPDAIAITSRMATSFNTNVYANWSTR